MEPYSKRINSPRFVIKREPR